MAEKRLIILDLNENECNGDIVPYSPYSDAPGKSFEIREQEFTDSDKPNAPLFTIYVCTYVNSEFDGEYEPIKGWHYDDHASIEDALKFLWETEC